MIRLFSKVQTIIGRVRKRLGPILPVLLTALIVALLVWGASHIFSLLHTVPQVIIPGLFSDSPLWKIKPQYVVFIAAFIFGALIGTWYFVYRPNRETVIEYWQQIPTWIRATTLGFGGAVLVTIVLLSLGTHWEIPDLVVLAAFLVSWPLTTGIVILSNRCIGGDCPRSTSIRIGYMHARGLESRTMAIIVGALVAVVGGFVTWAVSIRVADWDSVLLATVVAVLLWMLATVIVYNRYEAQTAERTGLAITDVNRPEARTTWELAIKNESNSTIDLSLARIRDTKFDLYRFGVDTDLGPGAVCTFNAPEDFRLAPNDDSWELPLGYTLKQGSQTPVILTRGGEMYALQRDRLDTEGDGSSETDASDSSMGESQHPSLSGQSPEDPSPQD
ncbi:hypothetical protein C499_00470 [Halogeometricum borinquense DSM 11551]|uniref:CTL/SLC44 family protein n=1 Tax=Halogeometricum borinquense (strain ATCC 700274 / DSM 11551 / JCM 10706 / KCTC 4070 / PR3) TaxID=469382 RepID=E4NVV6_HALBP|nr:hypothetical protein [Halogeometricum borinquense]ADQ69176.1 hypothetical protein Hbor_38620 [Halogeometricum borinquense DSM 11551]ELY31724.1 hypothetical protein C499_00470 [Halogeometricum borinquense DSM 11551]